MRERDLPIPSVDPFNSLTAVAFLLDKMIANISGPAKTLYYNPQLCLNNRAAFQFGLKNPATSSHYDHVAFIVHNPSEFSFIQSVGGVNHFHKDLLLHFCALPFPIEGVMSSAQWKAFIIISSEEDKFS
ncbi:hypothetical protein J1N35_041994 [Gossypium stocksii]|uniref:Uncharacterized protein n=1 Tax=Gossypium stocksii TaxID=47602 RepID=A0A9D3UGI8_9ROSI|nr:hypothetical protein J1N35_041994 [Gossypium stocksii]